MHVLTKNHTSHTTMSPSKITLGVIVGNRGFFPAHLCDTGRKEILATLEKAGLNVVALPTTATKFGAIESLEDAHLGV